MATHKNNGFVRNSLGTLGLTTEAKSKCEYPLIESTASKEQARKVLLDDYRSGYIDANELQEALLTLKGEP